MSEFTATLQSALAPSYTLDRELTGGGMSRVFLATDTTLGRKVVIKVLPPELAAGVNHDRFRREIQVAAQLQHPHIVPLLSAGEQQSLIWYTMPYINGHSLRDAIARGDKFSVKDVVRLMREVAEGLSYAHGMGVIHRDIKPGNVLLQGTHALVTDFGVSKAISAAMPSSGYTSAGMAIGTPAYMAPEQIAADPAADHRMDLYALGLLAYELLTGKVPFKEASPQQTMAAQLTRDPVPVETTRSDVPPAFAALIKRLLAKDPNDRPESAAAVVQALDAIATGSGETLALPPSRRARIGRTVFAVAAAVALMVTAWSMGQRKGEEAVVGQFRDSLATIDSLQAIAPAATMLTREDSMAIASAVSARMAARPAATATTPRQDDPAALAAMADSIRSQIQRLVLDSLMRIQTRVSAVAPNSRTVQFETNGPPSRGPRRVVVAVPRSNRLRADLDAAALVIADTLRRALDAHPRYVVVPADSVAAVLAESRTINTVQERLNADIIVSLSLIPSRDSLVRLVQVRDLTSPVGQLSRAVSVPTELANPTAGVDQVVRETFRALAEMDRTAREAMRARAAVSGAPAPPLPPVIQRP
jgi:tRNA A-37 threonylcarbamoyl transferase component Bud32